MKIISKLLFYFNSFPANCFSPVRSLYLERSFRNKAAFSFILVLFLVNVPLAIGQDNSFKKYQFTSLKNIPTQRAVASISQDDQGFIWMGTNGLGLYKYNGLDYTSYIFKEEDSLSLRGSFIYTTYVDKKNRLWVGTEAGLDLYNRDLDNFIHIDLSKTAEGTVNAVHAIMEDNNGAIFIGTHQHGLYKIHPSTLDITKVQIDGVPEVRNLLINSIANFDNRTVIATDHGLLYYDTETGAMAAFEFITSRRNEMITGHILTSRVDNKGSIWLGTTSNGLYKINGNENGRYNIQHFPVTSKRILSLLTTPRNTILCGTENDGMFEIDRNGNILSHYLNNKFDNSGIISNSIWSLFLDAQQRIWVGYYNNG